MNLLFILFGFGCILSGSLNKKRKNLGLKIDETILLLAFLVQLFLLINYNFNCQFANHYYKFYIISLVLVILFMSLSMLYPSKFALRISKFYWIVILGTWYYQVYLIFLKCNLIIEFYLQYKSVKWHCIDDMQEDDKIEIGKQLNFIDMMFCLHLFGIFALFALFYSYYYRKWLYNLVIYHKLNSEADESKKLNEQII